ncbi:MAG: nucleoid-associated protein [Motiliproteus sp.]|nr:nucleoid-associated protein [Motiliproteus sp.]MCW9052852.1 nucleoid-associated protein [Motiliproteus sp.]
MAITEAIVHFIDRPEGEQTHVSQRRSLLTLNSPLESLITKVVAAYNNRSGKIYGGFDPEQNVPFQGLLKNYQSGEIDLVQFSSQCLDQFKQQLDQQADGISGYLLFARQRVLEQEQLLILLLSTSPAVFIDEELELSDARHLDLGKVQLGAKIDLDEWQRQGSQYISLVKARSGKEINECFRSFLGCSEEVDAKEQTQALVKVFGDYCSQSFEDQGKVSEVKQKAYEYCNERLESGERVGLQDLSCAMDTTDPDKFFNYVAEHDSPLQEEIPADRRGLQKFVRYSGSMKGISVSFSEMLLGEQVVYDAENDTLIIRGTPPTLRKQLNRNT